VSGGELGLLGLTFHPQYKANGRFFVNYTRRVNGQLQTVIAEYHVSATDPNLADPKAVGFSSSSISPSTTTRAASLPSL